MSFLRRAFPSVLLASTLFVFVPGHAAEPDPKAISYALPDNIEWKKGAASDTAILQGDPSKPGLYVQLIKWHPHNMSRPHTHNQERYIMVLSGTWWVGTGPKWDPDTTFPMPAGSYVIDRPNQIHWDGAKDADCVIYLVGMGPVNTVGAEAK
jgi:quercetin dioxygenase-like cupin family protein